MKASIQGISAKWDHCIYAVLPEDFFYVDMEFSIFVSVRFFKLLDYLDYKMIKLVYFKLNYF